MDISSKTRDNLLIYFIYIGFGLSGAAALIYEVAWTRGLSTVMGSSTYAVSTMLAAFMTGLSVGGGLGALIVPRLKQLNIAFAFCELGIGASGLLTIPVIMALTPLYIKSFYIFHLSFNAFSIVQFLIIFMIMAIPTTLMGMTFPFVIKFLAKHRNRDIGSQVGRLYSINTFGAIIGSMICGFLLIPGVGIRGAAITAAGINIFTALLILVLSREFKKTALSVALILLSFLAATMIAKPSFPFFSYYNAMMLGNIDNAEKTQQFLTNSKDKEIVYHYEGVEGDVALIRYKVHNGEDGWALTNNGKREAGDDKGFSLLAYFPILGRSGDAKPLSALNIGLGSGHTLSELAKFPLKNIDSIELSKGILTVNREYLNPHLFNDSRIEHIQADGRNYLLVNQAQYDIIIASPSWAVEFASASMLTDEFFKLASKRLSDNGVFAIWIDYFLMKFDDFEIVARTFGKTFKHAMAWQIEGDGMILVGSQLAPQMTSHEISQTILSFRPDLQEKFRLGMSDEMIRGLPPGTINTDDHPVIEFHNARHAINWDFEK